MGEYRMAMWGGREGCAQERGRFEKAREARIGLMQMPYSHPGPDVWVCDSTTGNDFVCDPDEGRVDTNVQSWPRPSPSEALKGEGPVPHLGSTVQLTLPADARVR